MTLWTGVHSAELAPASTREIDQLLAALGGSGCEFYRNDTWYSAPDAQAHLAKKYEYLRKKDLLGSSEDFIAKAGTESSRSGKAYQVRCGREPAVASAAWLQAALRSLRADSSLTSDAR